MKKKVLRTMVVILMALFLVGYGETYQGVTEQAETKPNDDFGKWLFYGHYRMGELSNCIC